MHVIGFICKISTCVNFFVISNKDKENNLFSRHRYVKKEIDSKVKN